MTNYSLHIGVNITDRSQYPEPFQELSACVNDARAFDAIAADENFDRRSLHDEQANSTAVLTTLRSLSEKLAPGDLLLLTYSGHGAQVPSGLDDAEIDRNDETWVLYDRQLLDNELWRAWSLFKSGVRILLMSDSCHSGTIARRSAQSVIPLPGSSAPFPVGALSRRMPDSARDRDFHDRAHLYAEVAAKVPPVGDVPVRATVLLFVACSDNETALEVDGHGIFTRAFLDVWDSGSFGGSYVDLFAKVKERVIERVQGQTPNYLPLGREDFTFEALRPFAT